MIQINTNYITFNIFQHPVAVVSCVSLAYILFFGHGKRRLAISSGNASTWHRRGCDERPLYGPSEIKFLQCRTYGRGFKGGLVVFPPF